MFTMLPLATKLMKKMRAGDGILPAQPNFLSPMAR
jgi:hypothetical protein